MSFKKKFIYFFSFFFFFCTKLSSYKEVVHADIDAGSTHIVGVDVGGTNTDFGFFRVEDKKPVLVLSIHTKTKNISDFTDALTEVLDMVEKKYQIFINHVCIGAPGARSAEKDFSCGGVTNLNIDAKKIKATLGLETVIILNDFEVIGYGVDLLPPGSLVEINKGAPKEKAPRAIIGAGTGLGTSYLLWDDHNKHYFSTWSELGAVPFAPSTQKETALLQKNLQTTGRVSDWDYILGGIGGISVLYDFFAEKKFGVNGFEKKQAEEIFGFYGLDSTCTQAVEAYVRLYARFARIATLSILPYGGLYIAGGVVAKNADLFVKTNFLETFFDSKTDARTWPLLYDIPIYLITDYKVSLYGAAQYLLYTLLA